MFPERVHDNNCKGSASVNLRFEVTAKMVDRDAIYTYGIFTDIVNGTLEVLQKKIFTAQTIFQTELMVFICFFCYISFGCISICFDI